MVKLLSAELLVFKVWVPVPVRVRVEEPLVNVPLLLKFPPTDTVPPGAKVWLDGI